MSIETRTLSLGWTKRLTNIAILLAMALLALGGPVAPAAAQDGPTEYVKRVARELIAANRASNPQAFTDTINNHAHVQAIGTYALGSYRGSLKPTDRDSYFAGMVRFISRYAANESQKYHIANFEIVGPASRSSSGIVVDSRVHLKDGQTYEVQWLLQPAAGGYKVRDAKVQVLLGDYWMTPFLKDLFEKYIADNGSVAALVVALNR